MSSVSESSSLPSIKAALIRVLRFLWYCCDVKWSDVLDTEFLLRCSWMIGCNVLRNSLHRGDLKRSMRVPSVFIVWIVMLRFYSPPIMSRFNNVSVSDIKDLWIVGV